MPNTNNRRSVYDDYMIWIWNDLDMWSEEYPSLKFQAGTHLKVEHHFFVQQFQDMSIRGDHSWCIMDRIRGLPCTPFSPKRFHHSTWALHSYVEISFGSTWMASACLSFTLDALNALLLVAKPSAHRFRSTSLFERQPNFIPVVPGRTITSASFARKRSRNIPKHPQDQLVSQIRAWSIAGIAPQKSTDLSKDVPPSSTRKTLPTHLHQEHPAAAVADDDEMNGHCGHCEFCGHWQDTLPWQIVADRGRWRSLPRMVA